MAGIKGSVDHRRFHLLSLVLVLLAFVLYVAVQLPMPTHRGSDAAYYLLGCRHMREGRWPWGTEPPLAFVLLFPFTVVFPERLAFTICSSLAGALTLYFLGRTTAAAARVLVPTGPGRLEDASQGAGETAEAVPYPSSAAAWAVALGAAYMFFCFVSGQLKNAWANVFLLMAIEALLRGGSWAVLMLAALAALCHPGVTATWLVAFGLGGAFHVLPRVLRAVRRPAQPGRPQGPKPYGGDPPRQATGRLRLYLAATAVCFALAAGAYAAVPTVMRYLSTYLVSGPTVRLTGPLFQWYFSGLAVRYLPLWPLAWMGARLVGRRQTLPGNAEPVGGVLPRGALPFSGMLSLAAWVAVLGALSSITGLTSRRFEVQMFIPLTVLGALAASGWKPTRGSGALQNAPGDRRLRLTGRGLAVIALVFGLFLQVLTVLATQPVLSRKQVSDLGELGQELPDGARLVVVTSAIRYWAELLSGAPALSPGLLGERMSVRGPVFLLVQDPPSGGNPWPQEALSDLRQRGLVVWEEESGLFLLRGRDDPALLAAWKRSDSVAEMLTLLDGDAPPGIPVTAGDSASAVDQLAGWAAFPLLGLARACGLPLPAALALALPASSLVLLWLAGFGARPELPKGRREVQPGRGAVQRPQAS